MRSYFIRNAFNTSKDSIAPCHLIFQQNIETHPLSSPTVKKTTSNCKTVV